MTINFIWFFCEMYFFRYSNDIFESQTAPLGYQENYERKINFILKNVNKKIIISRICLSKLFLIIYWINKCNCLNYLWDNFQIKTVQCACVDLNASTFWFVFEVACSCFSCICKCVVGLLG